MSKLLTWRDVIDRPWPPMVDVTEATRQMTMKNATRFRGSVRLACGRIWTADEYEKRRQRILSKPLP